MVEEVKEDGEKEKKDIDTKDILLSLKTADSKIHKLLVNTNLDSTQIVESMKQVKKELHEVISVFCKSEKNIKKNKDILLKIKEVFECEMLDDRERMQYAINISRIKKLTTILSV